MKGYIVVESGNDFEQVLCLETGDDMPANGILCWPNEGFDRHVFESRKAARSAINRTYHYSVAFENRGMPDMKHCFIKVVNYNV